MYDLATQLVPNQSDQPVAAYPPPPRVHWAVLLIAALLAEFLIEAFLPSLLAGFVETLLLNAWLIYLCLWIRRLDPHARSLPWAFACVTVQLASNALQLALTQFILSPEPAVIWLVRALVLASYIFPMAVIFMIRGELEDHYNHREPMGLYLSPALTLFFSCLYFQYHLYDIAQFKKRQAQQLPANPRGTPLS